VQHCEEECETTGGAIFCDGQFLNYADVRACADQLAAELNIMVDIEVEGDVDTDCDGDECEADGDGRLSAGCLATVDPEGRGRGALLALMALLLFIGWPRKREPATV
jgi:MYXO-CTERM domain-containing protein